MRSIKDGYFDRLAAASGITSRLSSYAGVPAIFTRSPVPEDAKRPYIVIRESVTDDPFDTKTTNGRMVMNDIGIYGDETGDPELVDDISERVRDAIHRNPVTVSGYGSLIAVATGPVGAPTDDKIYGRIVTAQLTLIRA